MAAIGKYRRNLIDFEDNSRYILCWAIYTSSVVSMRKTAVMFPQISPVTMFRIGHGSAIVFIWFFHGLLLPLSMELTWKSKQPKKASPFYVRKPVLPVLNLPKYLLAPPPLTSPRTTTLSAPQTQTHNSECFQTLDQDRFRCPSPILPPIRTHSNGFSQNLSQQLESSHAEGEQNFLKTLYYSRSLNSPAKQKLPRCKGKKGIVGVNSVLFTALNIPPTRATSPEKGKTHNSPTSPRTVALSSPQTQTPNSECSQTSCQDCFRSLSPILPPIRPHSKQFTRNISQHQERSHVEGGPKLLNRPPKQKSPALEIQGTGDNNTNLKPFMCQVCNYECERYITLRKHINTKHRFPNISANREKKKITESPCRSSRMWGDKDGRRYQRPKRKVAPRLLEVQEATSTFTSELPQT